jgi:putative oxidoreductase
MMEQGRIVPAIGLLALSFRIILGIMFIYAGIEKAIDVSGFAGAVHNYRILPEWMINPFAVIVPWVETIAGLSLLSGVLLEGGALIISGLLLAFSCALALDLWRGLDISCGCFGTSAIGHPITWWYLLRDIILFGMGCTILISSDCARCSFKHLVHWARAKRNRANG